MGRARKYGNDRSSSDTARSTSGASGPHSPRPPVDALGAEALQQRERAGTADLDLGEAREVEQPDALARGGVLRALDRRPVAALPAGARWPRAARQELLVGGEPPRPLPSGA